MCAARVGAVGGRVEGERSGVQSGRYFISAAADHDVERRPQTALRVMVVPVASVAMTVTSSRPTGVPRRKIV